MERMGQLRLETPTNATSLDNLPLTPPTVPPRSEPRELAEVETTLRFLHYEPVRHTNLFFASLINHHRSIGLCLSLVLRPQCTAVDSSRFQAAVEFCRTHAAMGSERNYLSTGAKIWGLYLAGMAFGGPDLFPDESQWVLDRLDEIGSKFYTASITERNLERIWALKGNCWDASREVFQERSRAERGGN